ncbi:MAG: hypothetical protein D6760_08575 [Deltaproteobacteria bacterium]|nr:MAG: hypothetical protein D6760_08575 [Deltaproteobacteria bacterium]
MFARSTPRFRGRALFSFLALTVLLCTGRAHRAFAASAGDPDPCFGNGGRIVTEFSASVDVLANLVPLPGGKLTLVGSSNHRLGLARLDGSGTLDSSFADAGTRNEGLLLASGWGPGNGFWAADGLAPLIHVAGVQPNGKLVVFLGYDTGSQTVSNSSTLVRFGTDGAIDPTFGSAGEVAVDERLAAMAVAPNGKIVLAGKIFPQSPTDTSAHLLVARLTADGGLDATFGNGGTAQITFTALGDFRPAAIAFQPDGKIVIAGSGRQGYGPFDFAVARIDGTGHADGSFGSGGIVVTEISTDNDGAYDVAVDSSGRIVAAGTKADPGFGLSGSFAVVRYLTDGSLDNSFGSGGIVTTAITGVDLGFTLALQSDGRIVVAGTGNADGVPDVALARYLSDGSLDPSFGTSGTALVDLDGLPSRGAPASLVIDPTGRLLVGATVLRAGEDRDFAVARLLPDGSLDTTYGAGGWAAVGFPGSAQGRIGLRLNSGKTLVVGSAGWSLALAQYDSTGHLDPTFGNGGTTTTGIDEFRWRENVWLFRLLPVGAVEQPDGKIVVGASVCADECSWEPSVALARYLPDGRLDPSFGENGLAFPRGITVSDFSNSGDGLLQILLQSTGGIIALGQQRLSSWSIDVFVFRTASDGTSDGTFTTRSWDCWDEADIFCPERLALAPGDAILVAGTAYDFGPKGGTQLALVRLNADGSDDTTMNGGSPVLVDPTAHNDEIHGLAVAADGKITAWGASRAYDPGTKQWVTTNWFFVHLLADGSPDPAFPPDGVEVLAVPDLGGGKCTIGPYEAGRSFYCGGTTVGGDFLTGHFLPGGSLDPAFGTGGLATVDFRGFDDWGASLGWHGADALLQVGTATVEPGDATHPTRTAFAAVRYLTAPADPSCALATTTTIPVGPTSSTTLSSTTTTMPAISSTTSSSTTTTTLVPPCAGSCADADGSGRVTATDALLILRASVGLEICTPCRCDVDGNGKTTATDALAALHKAVGLPVTLACPA